MALVLRVHTERQVSQLDKDFDVIIVEPPKDPRFTPAPYEGDDEMLKHLSGQHDQQTHGSWASGAELSEWSPSDPIQPSPRNAGGMTETIWDNWEHGPDGNTYVELYRQYAGEALGIPTPKSSMDVGGEENYLTERGFGGSSTQTARGHAEKILQAIANGKPEQPALYRGMTATDAEGEALLQKMTSLKPGDTLDMPLVSTTRSLGVAAWYAADRSPSGKGNVIIKIQPGAKGISLSKEKSFYPQDHEVITSGKFEIVGVNTVQAPYWKRETLQPRKAQFRDETEPYYEVVGTKQNLGDPKTVYEKVTSGNWKSLETPTFKLTDDRHNNPERPILSAWAKQEPREFTVVEMKFVEPHVVKKAGDYGLTFDALFNNIPFFREEDMAKHGSHDQKTHGSWATGNYENLNDWIKEELSVFASDEEREKYIENTIDSQHISAYDNTKYSGAVETYEGRTGYDLNEALRDPQISDDGYMGTIQKLDEAIDAIEPIKEELIAYRGVKGNGLDFFNKLKVGDTYEDKGFTSTTIDPHVAKQFGGQQPYYDGLVFKYKLPAGTKGIFPSAFTDKSTGRDTSEAEFLLPRGSKFKVTAIRGKVWDVELIP